MKKPIPKKPISADTLAALVTNIRRNHAAFDADDDSSTLYARRVMIGMTQIMEDGHVIALSVWPMGYGTQIWDLTINDVNIVKGGVLFDEEAVPKLLKKGRS